MDFSFSEEQETIAKVARELFERRCSPERLTELEAAETRYDASLWKELAAADLLGIALPETAGGSGGGFLDLGLLLAEVGYSVAPVPLYATLLLGADPIAHYGDRRLRDKHLPSVVSGGHLLSAGLMEPGRSDVTAPKTIARRDGDSWRIEGIKELVPAGQLADLVLIPATTDDGDVAVFCVDPRGAGVEVQPVVTTNFEPHADLVLDGAVVAAEERIDAPVEELYARALVGLCAVQLGVAERAMRLAATYTSSREQFGRPVGSFQAVQQRMADAFIDVEAMRWTTWQAAWLLGENKPSHREAAIAKVWAAEAGARVVATAQQVHGGIGIDTSYPLFRYYLWGKHNELALGSAPAQLAKLGARYADRDTFGD